MVEPPPLWKNTGTHLDHDKSWHIHIKIGYFPKQNNRQQNVNACFRNNKWENVCIEHQLSESSTPAVLILLCLMFSFTSLRTSCGYCPCSCHINTETWISSVHVQKCTYSHHCFIKGWFSCQCLSQFTVCLLCSNSVYFFLKWRKL